MFDTVSSLGLPHLGLQGVRFDFEIIDTALSPHIKFGFHALAVDETRDVFSPTFWDKRDGVEQVIFPAATLMSAVVSPILRCRTLPLVG